MRILAAAKGGFDYNRTQILIKGLKGIGEEVEIYKIPDRTAKFGREFSLMTKDYDFVYVPPFRHRDLAFIRKYSQAPVVFDPLISRYLTKVVDYGHYWKAPQKWWIDYRDFRNCDLLVADTQAHLNYFQKTLKLPPSLATAVVPVGVDTDAYSQRQDLKEGPFVVGFYGTFVPLQGVRTIIEAAALLHSEKDIEFRIFGTGYQYDEMRKLAQERGLSNEIFKGWIDYRELAQELKALHLALGVFGQSLKTDLVVPNKLYHYASLGIPCITKQTPGIQEVFAPGENLITISADPKTLAQTILDCRNKGQSLQVIGNKAAELIHREYSHLAVAQRLVDAVKASAIL